MQNQYFHICCYLIAKCSYYFAMLVSPKKNAFQENMMMKMFINNLSIRDGLFFRCLSFQAIQIAFFPVVKMVQCGILISA